MLFVLGFFFIFILGGLTGVMVASVPFNLQVHDTFFVVAHLHYVLIGGSVFPLLGAVHYWFPKITGRMLGDRLSKTSFWLAFVGFNATFFPMHHVGLIGMPRRVYTYLEGLGWEPYNLLATVGAYVLATGILVFLVNVGLSLRGRASAPDDVWNGDTLEWATSSPPPNYNHDPLPGVLGRWGRWDAGGELPRVRGIRADRREVLVTDMLDGTPQGKTVLPAPSAWPLALACAVAVTFVGVIFTEWAVPIGALLSFVAMVGWLWPSRKNPRPPWQKEGTP
jgi:cytochrome c oxidase subunit I+III